LVTILESLLSNKVRRNKSMNLTLAPTLSYRLWPRANNLLRDVLLIVGGSLLVAALAQVRILLPFTPVPVTGQTLGVLLVGAALGSRRGASSMALYLVEGIVGLPVFTGGSSGLLHLAGPTGGYLVGFVAAAFVVGYLSERGLERNLRTSLLPFLAGEVVIFLFGVSWLALAIGLPGAILAGLLPFLPGEAVKVALAALALPAAWRLVK
jgi:biotin transport system substrate-specific component